MNSSAFSRIIVTFAIMILALWVTSDVFGSRANALGQFYKYILISGGLIGLCAPRKGFYLLLFLTGYLDYFKRLMVLDTGLSQFDLYYVLGIAPATLAGICASLVYQFLTGSLPHRRYEGRIMACTLAVMGISAYAALGGGFRAVGDMVNGVVYLGLLFVMPIMFRTPQELRHIMKVSILIFVPSVAYYLYQTYAGFTWWEYEYMVRGYTIEVRQLGERIPRVFGTMNGAGAAVVIYSMHVALLVFGGFWKYKDDTGKRKHASLIVRLFLAYFFAWAAYRTFSRAGWIQGLLAASCFFAFRSRLLTRAAYGTMAALILLVVLSSEYVMKHKLLNEWSHDIAGSDGSNELHQATNLATFNARLEGFSYLVTDSSLWTPFGLKLAGKNVAQVYSGRSFHDAFSSALLKVGFVPLGIAFFLIFRFIQSMHRFILRQPDGLSATLAAASLSCAVGIFIGVTHNGAALMNYPVNFYLYFYMGIVLGLMVYHAEKEYQEKRAALATAPRTSLRNRSQPYLNEGSRRPLRPERPQLTR